MKPRLHVLLARDAPIGLVWRRGPSDQVASIGWDRRTDTFELGQWLKGRVYERRSDLSPDGKHVIYFAMNGHWSSRAKGAWTAISRTPYLRAVTLYAKGDCWNGGGLFLDSKLYWLNNGYGHELLEDTEEVRRAPGDAFRPTWGGECLGVYFPKLIRDGWILRPELGSTIHGGQVWIWDKLLAHGWMLRKRAHAERPLEPGRGVYYDTHELVHGQRVHSRPAWEWADSDRGRLVWAEDGALWTGSLTKRSAELDDPVDGAKQLYDFTPLAFEEIRAPYADRPERAARRRAKRS